MLVVTVAVVLGAVVLGLAAAPAARTEPRRVDSTNAEAWFDIHDEVLTVCWPIYAMTDPRAIATVLATHQDRLRLMSDGLAASLRASDETRRGVARHHADLGAARLDTAFAAAGAGEPRAARAAERTRLQATLQSIQSDFDRLGTTGAEVVADGPHQGLRRDQLSGLRDRTAVRLDVLARAAAGPEAGASDPSARERAAREALRASLLILATQEGTERRVRARLAVMRAVAKGVELCVERQLADIRAGRVKPPPTSGAPPGRLVGSWQASCPRPGYEPPRYAGRLEFDIAADGRLIGSHDGDWGYGSLLGTSETGGAVEGRAVGGPATFLFSGTVQSAGGVLRGGGTLLRSDGGDKCPGTWRSP